MICRVAPSPVEVSPLGFRTCGGRFLKTYAYSILRHIEVFNAMGHHIERFLVSGRGSSSRVWMQVVADVLQGPTARLTCHPGSRLSAWCVTAVGAGLTADLNGVSAFVARRDWIEPDPSATALYEDGYRAYRVLRASVPGIRRSRL
jgi:xylulokinase